MTCKVSILAALLAVLLAQPLFAQSKPRLLQTNNDFLFMKVTEPLYKDHIDTDTGAAKKATEGNVFAQVVVFFYFDKNPQKGGPTSLMLDPANLLLLNEKQEGQQRKIFSGVKATQFMARANKPFKEPFALKPGEEKMLTMCFHIPKNAKIVGIMYKLDKMNPLIVDFRQE